jgi:hypothetical protein
VSSFNSFATLRSSFVDVNTATAAGYQPFLGCVSGPDHGAMGYHYVNGALVGGELDASRPQVMIYEASGRGLQLVGVEFVVIADAWLAQSRHSAGARGAIVPVR